MKPRGLSDAEMRIVMSALQSIPRCYRAWVMGEIITNLQHGTTLNEAIGAAIERQHEAAE